MRPYMEQQLIKKGERYMLDLRGLICPYPQIYTVKALQKVEKGAIIDILIDNPASCSTVPSVAEKNGHKVISNVKEDKYWKITVQKS
ncbi:MAG: sulfurtransferase TusA family protein [Thermocladium sp.]